MMPASAFAAAALTGDNPLAEESSKADEEIEGDGIDGVPEPCGPGEAGPGEEDPTEEEADESAARRSKRRNTSRAASKGQ
jgi:hypothetical protein